MSTIPAQVICFEFIFFVLIHQLKSIEDKSDLCFCYFYFLPLHATKRWLLQPCFSGCQGTSWSIGRQAGSIIDRSRCMQRIILTLSTWSTSIIIISLPYKHRIILTLSYYCLNFSYPWKHHRLLLMLLNKVACLREDIMTVSAFHICFVLLHLYYFDLWRNSYIWWLYSIGESLVGL